MKEVHSSNLAVVNGICGPSHIEYDTIEFETWPEVEVSQSIILAIL